MAKDRTLSPLTLRTEQKLITDFEARDVKVACWCSKPAIHYYWCRDHVPSCRSGAHFFGNCLCIGSERTTMTLHEQVREVATRTVSEEWSKRTPVPRLIDTLLAKAFVDDWERVSHDSRVLLKAEEIMRTTGALPVETPGEP